ncbi:hypothetical protein [Nonomuraea sp. NPDC049695]|uniref:hypothetical protein n=1 Tax=Nonomuraea sp. NPDC049695 TaxID=3154734 RepID=UPI00342FB98B
MSTASTWMYRSLVGIITAEALLLRSKWAISVATAMAVMLSNLDGMDEAVKEWHKTDKQLGTLKTELDKLRTELKDKGKWDGTAESTFDEAYDSFQKSLDELGRASGGTGDAVGQYSTISRWGAAFASMVAAIMHMVVLVRYLSATNPWARLAALTFEHVVSKGLLTAVKSVLKKHTMAVGVVAGATYMAVKMQESSGKAFPMAKAVPAGLNTGGGMEFQFPQLEHQEGVGLSPKVDTESLGTMPKSGGGILGI